jgi:tetratricopeptide (TPR) repeat protein
MSDHHGPGAAVGWLRAHNTTDGLAGCAFLVAPDLVLTCAHVVAAHLGLGRPAPADAPDAPISIRFEAIQQELPARLVAEGWFTNAPQPPGALADIAILRLETPFPSAGALPAIAARLPTQRCPAIVHGAEAGYQSFGQTVACHLTGANIARGLRQLDPHAGGGFVLGVGFSGAPVMDELGNIVWGMVVAAAQSGGGVAYAIPADRLRDALQRAGLHLYPAVLAAIAQDKGVREAPLRAFFDRLGDADLPPADIPARLAAFADELLRLRADLARLRDDHPEFAALRARALALIDQDDFPAARAVLAQGRADARDLRRQYSRTEAAFLADEARLAHLLLDHPTALANFTEAARLDPDNVWIAIDLGDLHHFHGALSRAAAAYTDARDAAQRANADRDLCVSHNKIGDIRRDQGDLQAALASYQAALAIAERLAAADPANAEAQRDLSISHNKIGDIRRTQRDLQAAMLSHLAALVIAERLAAADPANAEAQRDLSTSHDHIGDILRTQNELQPALARYQAALAIRESLAAIDPANANAQCDLCVSHNKIGDTRREQGDLQAALASYQAALAIAERLAAADPANAEAQRDLSISHNKIGDIRRDQGEHQAALASYLHARAIRERRAAADPANALAQRDLAASHTRIGGIRVGLGELQAALASYQAALANHERLADTDPANAEAQRDLSVSHNNIGDIRRAQGDLRSALASYLAALAIRERRAAADPDNALAQRDLAVSLGRAALANPDPVAARHALTRARDLLGLVVLSPTTAAYRNDLAWIEAELARRTP